MTMPTMIVLGLVALLVLVAAMLWRGAGRSTATIKAAKRAQRLREQLAWDRTHEDPKGR